MTYEELTSRLNRVETALTALKTGSYQTADFNVEATVQQLETLQTTLQEQIATLTEEKAIVTTAKGDEALVDINPNDPALRQDPTIKSVVTTKGRKLKEEDEVEEGLKDKLKGALYGIAGTIGIQKYGMDIFNKVTGAIANALPAEKAYEFSAYMQDIVDFIATTADKVPMEEDHHNNPTDDSDMAKIQLLQVAEYSRDLLNMIEDGQELDAWIQAKITKISDYIGTVKHYLEGEDYLAGEHDEDHPAHGDEEFYEEIPTEYKEMYESWVKSLFKKEPSVIGKIINYQGDHYKILDIDKAGTVEVIAVGEEGAKPFYLNRAQLKQGVIDDTQEYDTEEMELDIHPEDE